MDWNPEDRKSLAKNSCVEPWDQITKASTIRRTSVWLIKNVLQIPNELVMVTWSWFRIWSLDQSVWFQVDHGGSWLIVRIRVHQRVFTHQHFVNKGKRLADCLSPGWPWTCSSFAALDETATGLPITLHTTLVILFWTTSAWWRWPSVETANRNNTYKTPTAIFLSIQKRKILFTYLASEKNPWNGANDFTILSGKPVQRSK